MSLVILAIILFLAYVNGANDNFKGVATLFSSNLLSYKSALVYGTVFTFLGSISALFIATVLVDRFSGKGLLPIEELDPILYLLAIGTGCTLTVFTATKIGMPVSTTHALLGGILGVGIATLGKDFNFLKLTHLFLLPLILSPLLATILSVIFYYFFKRIRKKLKIKRETCICIGKEYIPLVSIESNGSCENMVEYSISTNKLTISTKHKCVERYTGQLIGVDVNRLISASHLLSAGWVSFARGLNDTPKIAGLLVGLNLLNLEINLILVSLVMALGAFLNAKKVAITMAKKITKLNQGQGVTANIVTSGLVTMASVLGMPVSTTHVSVGAIFGMGIHQKNNNLKILQKLCFHGY